VTPVEWLEKDYDQSMGLVYWDDGPGYVVRRARGRPDGSSVNRMFTIKDQYPSYAGNPIQEEGET